MFFLKQKNKYIITIRNPIDRFYSAFYHAKFRQRITYRPKELFKQFPHANDLAESIYSNDKKLKKRVLKAFKYTHHLRESLITFIDKNTFLNNKPFYIFEVESLQKDLNRFCKKCNIPKTKLPKKNKLNYKLLSPLSKKSIKNLKRYYKKDIELYLFLIKHKQTINNHKNK